MATTQTTFLQILAVDGTHSALGAIGFIPEPANAAINTAQVSDITLQRVMPALDSTDTPYRTSKDGLTWTPYNGASWTT